jgi:two-component system NarL family sensor kinase
MLKKEHIIYLLIGLLSWVFELRAQDAHRVDSLKKVITSHSGDSLGVKASNSLFGEYRYSDPAEAEKVSLQAISLGRKTGYTKGLALALYNRAVFEGEKGNFAKSDSMLKLSMEAYVKIGHRKGEANCFMAMGNNHYDKTEFVGALEYYIRSAKIREEVGDKNGLSASYIWIGNVYNNGMKRYDEARKYFQKALKIQEENGDEYNKAFTYNNIGISYYGEKKYKESLENFFRSVEIKEKTGNKRGLSAPYNNIGNIYTDIAEYDKALDYYERSLKLRIEFEDSPGIATSHVNIGNVYIKQKQFDKGIKEHEQAFELAKQIGYKEGMQESLTGLSAAWEAKGNAAKAFGYYKKASVIKDSILNTSVTEQIAEMETRYESERKELENAQLKNDNLQQELEIKDEQQKNRIKNLVLVAVSILVLLAALLIWSASRRKKIRQEASLAAERARQRDLRSKAVIDAEEKERIRIAQDLHDGVGQLLSAAKLNLSGLEAELQLNDEHKSTLFKNAMDLVNDSVKEVRSVSHSMMPNTLIKLGLASAVREFITKLSTVPNLKIDLEIVGLDERLDQQVESVLYRVIQETMNNIIRHAKANRIGLQLIRHEKELTVMIEDNGVGFDTSLIKNSEGLGLKGIISRIEFLNGSVDFDSAVGKGTTVIIELPLV